MTDLVNSVNRHNRQTSLKDEVKVEANKESFQRGTQQEQERIDRIAEFAKNPLANILSIISFKHTGTERELQTILTGLLYTLRAVATEEGGGILQFRGSSSAGKTNMANTILNCFPEKWIKHAGDISTNALKYIDWNDEKILYIQEAGGAEKATEHLKLMDSGDGGFKALVTLGSPATGFHTEEITIPVKFIITTRAEGMFDSQLENRMFCLSIDESHEQTFLVVLHRCKAFAGHLQEKSFKAIREFIQSLKTFDEITVPYSYEFLKILNQKKIRVRRDIDKILSLCQTSAYLNQKNRPTLVHNGKKVLFSTPEDAYNVFKLAFPSFEETVTGLSKKLQVLYNAIPENKNETITYRELAKKIGWNKRRVIRAIENQLEDIGLVTIDTSSNTHNISRADPIEKIVNDFEKNKKNILLYTAIELCLRSKKCTLPLLKKDINEITKCDTNCDKLGQKNDECLKNCDKNHDKSVTKLYTIDELEEYFKNKEQIVISHFHHGFVTLNVTLSPSGEHVSFIYCNTVTKNTEKDDFKPDITLDLHVPSSHSGTPALNDILRDVREIISENPEDNYEIILNKYGQSLIDKGLEQGILTEPLCGKKLEFVG